MSEVRDQPGPLAGLADGAQLPCVDEGVTLSNTPLHYADLGDIQQAKPLPGKASL